MLEALAFCPFCPRVEVFPIPEPGPCPILLRSFFAPFGKGIKLAVFASAFLVFLAAPKAVEGLHDCFFYFD